MSSYEDYPFYLLEEKKRFENHTYQYRKSSSNYWTLENGYKTERPFVYPRRALNLKRRGGLDISLRTNEFDLDYICRGGKLGYKASLHTPGEIPRTSKDFFRIELGSNVEVNVKPKMTITSKGLARYPPETRRCYFNEERKLKFFKVYTQLNCELECLTNFTLQECGCVKFSMPRDNQTRICMQMDIKCMKTAENDLMVQELKMRLSSKMKSDNREIVDCNCLTSCTSIIYEAEISDSDVDIEKIYNALGAAMIPNATISK